MKVLSIKEPYASLIVNNIKKIETRSWKTKYRGELLIHASKTKEKNLTKEVVSISKKIHINCGKIIGKANLKDCVYMDEEFIKKIKENPIEFQTGVYKVGRYAWILEDIKPLVPIPAKGKLNIWDYDGEYELLNKIK